MKVDMLDENWAEKMVAKLGLLLVDNLDLQKVGKWAALMV